jgi:hypothetical protein
MEARFRRGTLLAVLGLILGLLHAGCDDDDPTGVRHREYTAAAESAYHAATACTLVIGTYVGAIRISQAAEDSIRVTATRRAEQEADLEEIAIAVEGDSSRLCLTATVAPGVQNTSADFTITTPEDTRLELHSGVGAIECAGRAEGFWRASVGVGDIELALPAATNATVELATGVGRVDIEFEVAGSVSDRSVSGTIGTGADAEISAAVGVGSIDVTRQ